MYQSIVKRKVRATWKRINAGDLGAPAALATDDVRFEFVGHTPLSAQLQGRDAFREWFEAAVRQLPGVTFEVLDVAVHGWPWNTRVATRIRVSSAEFAGSHSPTYENVMAQWITLRWGKMTDDWVMEDTEELNHVFAANSRSQAGDQRV